MRREHWKFWSCRLFFASAITKLRAVATDPCCSKHFTLCYRTEYCLLALHSVITLSKSNEFSPLLSLCMPVVSILICSVQYSHSDPFFRVEEDLNRSSYMNWSSREVVAADKPNCSYFNTTFHLQAMLPILRSSRLRLVHVCLIGDSIHTSGSPRVAGRE